MSMTLCRCCRRQIAVNANTCPHCGESDPDFGTWHLAKHSASANSDVEENRQVAWRIGGALFAAIFGLVGVVAGISGQFDPTWLFIGAGVLGVVTGLILFVARQSGSSDKIDRRLRVVEVHTFLWNDDVGASDDAGNASRHPLHFSKEAFARFESKQIPDAGLELYAAENKETVPLARVAASSIYVLCRSTAFGQVALLTEFDGPEGREIPVGRCVPAFSSARNAHRFAEGLSEEISLTPWLPLDEIGGSFVWHVKLVTSEVLCVLHERRADLTVSLDPCALSETWRKIGSTFVLKPHDLDQLSRLMKDQNSQIHAG